jgi:eukaryotic-like serine/threonine-protein kinase
MKPERWQQLENLFQSALERDASQRSAFLDEACRGDEALRSKVESLIASHEQAGSFMEAPAFEVAARSLAAEPAESLVGQWIGHYEIVSPLGEGGMGEVYLAKDTRLGRKIALKLLPADLTEDEERLRRFRQEAQAAATLNHPNVCMIHEVGATENGRPFIAMEYIDGVTLRWHMARTPMKIREALDIAGQVASALAGAHAAGIMHRDIKPENIMVRRDGYIKVLDFGLAKLTEREVASIDAEAPTKALVATGPGVVMGTARYMSPEQARGLAVDTRTDIWSLGAVIYEMVAGREPFEGETATDVVASILNREPPPLARYSREVPETLEWMVTKALRKDREERYQTVKELLTDLRSLRQRLEFAAELERSAPPELKEGAAGRGQVVVETVREPAVRSSEVGAARPTTSAEYLISEIKRHKTGVFVTVAALVLAIAGSAALYEFIWQKPSTTKRGTPFQTMKITRLATAGKAVQVVISPDGKYIAYAVDDGGKQSLWIKQVAIPTSNAQIIPPDEGFYGDLTFSRDGNYIYYVKGKETDPKGVLYQVPALGGPSKKLIVDVAGIVFSPDGKRLAFGRYSNEARETALFIANMDGSGEQKLATRKIPGNFWIGADWSPDGKIIACVAVNLATEGTYMSVVAVPVEGGAQTPITSEAQKPITSQRWYAIERIAWLSDGSGLIMRAADQASADDSQQLWHLSYPGGEARKITNDLNHYTGVSLTADSSALVTLQEERRSDIWIVPDGDTSRAKQIPSGAGRLDGREGVAWTPDGKIVYASKASSNYAIWSMEADGTGRQQLTDDTSANYDAMVSPDGRYIVFASERKGELNIWRMDIDGSNPKQLTNGKAEGSGSFSPDGQFVVYENIFEDRTIWKVPIDGGDPVQLTDKRTPEPTVSPDGKLIVCYYKEHPDAPSYKIAIIPFEGGQPTKIFDVPQTVPRYPGPRWTADGRAVAYVDTRNGISNIWIQPLDGGPPKQLTDFKSDLIFDFEWSRDGRQLALARGIQTTDVVLITDFK